MTIREVLTAVGVLKPSQYDEPTLVRWMSELEARIWQDVLCHYEDDGKRAFPHGKRMPHRGNRWHPLEASRYAPPPPPLAPLTMKNMEQKLLIDFPHDDLYVKWLCAQIDYHNAEYDRYNNAMVHFNAGLEAFSNWYNREHMPRQDHFISV